MTLGTLKRIVEDFGDNNHTEVILDFENVLDVQNNLNPVVSQLKINSKTLILLNVNFQIITKLGIDIFNNPNNKANSEFFELFIVSDTLSTVILKTEELFTNEFIKYLIKHSIDNEGYNKINNKIPIISDFIPHISSSVYITKYIDVKRMISDDKAFFIYCLYKLSLIVRKQWLAKKPTLVCQNLNSSYIASILSSFLKFDILVFDKLGPTNKIYSTLDNKIETDKEYLIVSDVVALGTEMKIAKSLITFLGGKYLGNISLIRIETLHPEVKQYGNTSSLFTISKDNNPIEYQILTELNKG